MSNKEDRAREDALDHLVPFVPLKNDPISAPVKESLREDPPNVTFVGGRGITNHDLYEKLLDQGFSPEEAAKLSISLTPTKDVIKEQIDKLGLFVPGVPESGKGA